MQTAIDLTNQILDLEDAEARGTIDRTEFGRQTAAIRGAGRELGVDAIIRDNLCKVAQCAAAIGRKEFDAGLPRRRGIDRTVDARAITTF